MKKQIALLAVLVVAPTLALSTPSYGLSNPKPFPVGDTYIALPCDNIGDPVNRVSSVAADGSSTGVGTAVYEGECHADGSYDVVTGAFIAWNWNNDELHSVDVTTGVQTLIGNGNLALGGQPFTDVNAVFVDVDGTIFVVSWDFPSVLYSVALGAADAPSALTRVGELPGYISTMATDPTTGKVYAQDPFGDLYEIDLADASEIASYPTNCDTSQWGFGPGDCWGLDFDSTGGLWYQSDNGDAEGNAMLASATLPTTNGDSITLVEQGVFTDTVTGTWYGESTGLILAPAAEEAPVAPPASAPELAATGLNVGDSIAAAAAALAVAALGGALLVVRRRAAVR